MKRFVLILIAILVMHFSVSGQQENNTVQTALLVIDIQEFYFPGEGPGLVNAEGASLKAGEILQLFREKEQLVVHVRHKADNGFEIHKNVEPLATEKLITKEKINSFQGTDLLEYLSGKEIGRLVIVGMQTQLCVEAVTRAASDFGFDCIVIQDACATRNIEFGAKKVKAEDVHATILAALNDGGYAKIINAEDFIENTDVYLFRTE